MKNVFAILLFIGLLIPSFSFGNPKVNQETIKIATTEKPDSTKNVNKKLAPKHPAQTTVDSMEVEKRKKEIDIKEHTVNKNKKVRRFGVDENLSNMIKKRNIP